MRLSPVSLLSFGLIAEIYGFKFKVKRKLSHTYSEDYKEIRLPEHHARHNTTQHYSYLDDPRENTSPGYVGSKSRKARKNRFGNKSSKASKSSGMNGKHPKASKSLNIDGKSPKVDIKSPTTPSAVFTMTNSVNGNRIVMYTRDNETGNLTLANTISTEGLGGSTNLVRAAQDSLVVICDCLLAVNSGSNTISTFKIESGTSIIFVNQINTGGDIPVSIASYNDLIYVLNAGGAGSISGFKLKDNCELSKIAGSNHSLFQDPEADDPPRNPADLSMSSPTQIGFTPDGEKLIISVKGIRKVFNYGGSLLQFAVNSNTDDITMLSPISIGVDSILPRGFTFDYQGNLLLVDGNGEKLDGDSTVSLFNVLDTDISRAKRISLTGQMGGCCIRYTNGCTFNSNTVSGTISVVKINDEDCYPYSESDGEDWGFELVEDQASSTDGSGTKEQSRGAQELNLSPDGKFLYILSTTTVPTIYIYKTETGHSCGLEQIGYVDDITGTDSTGTTGIVVYSKSDPVSCYITHSQMKNPKGTKCAKAGDNYGKGTKSSKG